MAWLSKQITIFYILFCQGASNALIEEADHRPLRNQNNLNTREYNPSDDSDVINDVEKSMDHDMFKYMASLRRNEISKWLKAFKKEDQLRGTISDIIDVVETEINTIGKEKLEHLHDEITNVFDDVVVYFTKEKSMTEEQLNNAGWMNVVDFIQNEVTNHFNEKVERELKLYIGETNDNIWKLVQDESMDVEELEIALNNRKQFLLEDRIIRGTLDKIFEMLSSDLTDEVSKFTIEALERLENPLEEKVDSAKITEALRKMHQPVIFAKIEREVLLKERKGRLRPRT